MEGRIEGQINRLIQGSLEERKLGRKEAWKDRSSGVLKFGSFEVQKFGDLEVKEFAREKALKEGKKEFWKFATLTILS